MTHSFVYPLITAASDCRIPYVQTRAHNKTLVVKVVKAVLPLFFFSRQTSCIYSFITTGNVEISNWQNAQIMGK